MASIDELQKAETQQETDIAALKRSLAAYQVAQAQIIADLKAAGTNTAAVDAVVTKLQANNSALEALAASLPGPVPSKP